MVLLQEEICLFLKEVNTCHALINLLALFRCLALSFFRPFLFFSRGYFSLSVAVLGHCSNTKKAYLMLHDLLSCTTFHLAFIFSHLLLIKLLIDSIIPPAFLKEKMRKRSQRVMKHIFIYVINIYQHVNGRNFHFHAIR